MLWTRKAGVLLTLEDTVEFFNLIDGTKLTPQEKQNINKRQNSTSRQIHEDKHGK